MISFRAYFELLRFPAVFTAIADVTMGYLVRHGGLKPLEPFLLIVATSAALYLGGMAFNDAFDAETDTLERPERPIPSGRVGRAAAFCLGWLLFAIGVGAAWLIYFREGDRGPAGVAMALALFIYLYDRKVKHYSIGPLNMGACRVLNVLLGMSLVGLVNRHMPQPWSATEVLLASGIGVYVAGVTLFARGEASASDRRQLAGGMTLIAAGFAAIALAPSSANDWPLRLERPMWLLLWALLFAVIVRRCLAAWREPSPSRVRQAVRLCIRSLIVINAAIVLGFCGPAWGCAVLALLAPMLVLERWASTT